MEKEKQLEKALQLRGQNQYDYLLKIIKDTRQETRKELIEEFEKMTGNEIKLMKDCKSEAIKSQNNSQFESNQWYREQGEKYAYEVGIITLKRIIKYLQELKIKNGESK